MGEFGNDQKFDAPDRDEIHDLLSNHRRRYVLHYCKQNDPPVTLSELAEQVAAWEQGKSIAELTSAERKRVYTSLQQTHLDRLAEAGMVQYDGDEIELTEEAEELEVYLDVVPKGSIPWGVYYLGLSILAFVVFFGVWMGWVPTETISEAVWGLLVLAVFLISSIVHVYENRRQRLDRLEGPPPRNGE